MPPSTILQAALVILFSLASSCMGKKVVMLPMPFTSHTKYHTHVARQLVKLGHQVWLIMPDYLAEKGVLDTTDITVIQHAVHYNVEEAVMHGFRDNYFQGQRDDFGPYISSLKDHCRILLTNETFFKEMKSIGPDLILIDQLPNLKTLAVLAYRLGVPYAFIGSAYDPLAQRIPVSPGMTPFPVFVNSDQMTFLERLRNVLLLSVFSLKDIMIEQDAVALYAPEMPYVPVDMLYASAELFLVEIDHILDYPKPTLPNVKLIGGTATGPAKPLPAHFRTFMDDATQGVVIVSFGSYVLSVPTDISDKLFNVFERLPMKVVFRSNLTSPDPSKIMTSRWLPQNDLLGHANAKVFVSHCGNNGQYEAVYHAVPIVAVPLFADQPYNAERARLKGFAEVVDLLTSTEKELTDAILKVAGEPRYKQAITKLSSLLKKFNGVPVEKAAFWLDHVMEYGGGYMRSAGQQMPYYQFLMIDVILFLLAVFFVLGIVLCFCVCSLCRCLFKKKLKSE